MRTLTKPKRGSKRRTSTQWSLALILLCVAALSGLIATAHYWVMVKPAIRLEGSDIFYSVVPGIDLTNFASGLRSTLLKRLNHDACTCDCRKTLAHCRHTESDACPRSRPLIQHLISQLKA